MTKTYKVSGINCQSCANLIMNSLEDMLESIEVNMEAEPKEVTITASQFDEKSFFEEMEDLGFQVIEEVR